MRFFFAYNGALPHLDVLETTGRAPYNILLSYEYLKMGHLERIKAMLGPWFLLDSGAFSAWTKKKSVDIADYIETVGKVQEIMGGRLIAINLDVIPGEFGRKPSKREVRDACEQGWENYRRIRRETNAEIMPVFHQHDDWEWLDRYIKTDCYVLGISPANDLSSTQRLPFLSRSFAMVRDQKRCHGLAATAMSLMLKYPWYSVDSATWVVAPANGHTAWFDPAHRALQMAKYRERERFARNFRKELMDGPDYRGYKERIRSFINAFCDMEAYINTVWKRRGFTWND